MRQAGREKNSVCTVSFFGPTSKASSRPIGALAGSATFGSLPLAPHAAAALGLGARLDLADALARQPEDLADVAQRQLVVLQDSVAQLDDRLLLEGQLVDGVLHRGLLPQRVEQRHAIGVDLRIR